MTDTTRTSNELLDLHCAHGQPVYSSCGSCEQDAKAGKTRGFTPAAAAALVVEEGYLCEAGNIDMGLKRGSPRAIGCVIEVPGSADIEIRGLTKNAAAELAKHLRGRVRLSIELIGDSDE